MNPIWRRLDAIAGVAVQRTFAEIIRITPRVSASDYVAASPDATRPIVELRAVFSEETSAENLRGQRVSGESRGTTQMVSHQSAIQIMASEYARLALLGFELADGDLITLIQRPGCPSYSINLADQLDTGDVILYLSPEKAP